MATSALLTDLYQLNMMAAYLEYGLTEPAVFELLVRKLSTCPGFLMAAGIEQTLQFLETGQRQHGASGVRLLAYGTLAGGLLAYTKAKLEGKINITPSLSLPPRGEGSGGGDTGE